MPNLALAQETVTTFLSSSSVNTSSSKIESENVTSTASSTSTSVPVLPNLVPVEETPTTSTSSSAQKVAGPLGYWANAGFTIIKQKKPPPLVSWLSTGSISKKKSEGGSVVPMPTQAVPLLKERVEGENKDAKIDDDSKVYILTILLSIVLDFICIIC